MVVTACGELDGDYSTNPNLRLAFSVDTLSFDTVFTTIGTATRSFLVYNLNKEALNIETVSLDNTQTVFRFNVDGRRGDSFSNIRIAGNDSLFVFVEATVNPNESNQPLLVEDHLSFTVNGTTQKLLLQAYGQDVRLYKGGLALECDTLWTAERPYLIYDSIVIPDGVTLSIAKGATFYMHDKARWIVNGALKAAGTLDEPIVFRGDRLDNLMQDVPYDRIANQWDGLYFGAGSFGNEMSHVVLRNGYAGLSFLESAAGEYKLKISDSQVTNMEKSILTAAGCRIEAVNTEFSNATGHIASLSGGDYHFTHCTFANYYIIRPGRSGLPVLGLRNYIPDDNAQNGKKSAPLNVIFDNCLIDGSFSEGKEPLKGEISVDRYEGETLEMRFNHCAVKTMKTEDDRFIRSLFINKDNAITYKSAGNADNGFRFDFRPDTAKVIIGAADPSVAALYPLDRLGIDRLGGDGPDIGAYEYVPEPEKTNGPE
jgi:hypothetical protein